MKIRYKKKRLRFYLIMMTFWLIFGIVNIFFNEIGKWTTYVLLGLSTIYVVIYSFSYFNQYLTIQNGIIKENKPFGKKINLTEIKQIKKFAGDYIIKTDKTEMIINTQLIDPKSLTYLNNELEKLKLNFNK